MLCPITTQLSGDPQGIDFERVYRVCEEESVKSKLTEESLREDEEPLRRFQNLYGGAGITIILVTQDTVVARQTRGVMRIVLCMTVVSEGGRTSRAGFVLDTQGRTPYSPSPKKGTSCYHLTYVVSRGFVGLGRANLCLDVSYLLIVLDHGFWCSTTFCKITGKLNSDFPVQPLLVKVFLIKLSNP